MPNHVVLGCKLHLLEIVFIDGSLVNTVCNDLRKRLQRNLSNHVFTLYELINMQ
jgi:hypothetical protein